MNTIEFSREFDLLYNNITSNQAPGLNEYEKSVFLTKAQRQIILESFNAKTDSIGEGFDGGQRRQYDFSNLIQTKVRTQIFDPTVITIDNRSRLFEFPNDWLLSINEVVESNTAGDTLSVTPLNNEEYRKYMSKPYKFPPRSIAWRLINSGNSIMKKKVVELIYPDDKYTNYKIRYVRSPKPIILEDLTNYGTDITIDGETAVRECELPSDCHQEILDRAVLLAKAVWLNIASDKPKTN